MNADSHGIGEITLGEERVCRTLLATYKTAVEDYSSENQLPPIMLGDLTPDTLRQLVRGDV